MPSKHINRLLWLVMLGVLAVLVARFDVTAFLGSGRLTVTTDPTDARTVIMRWRGAIEPPMQSSLVEAIAEHRGKADRFVLSLSSAGGSVSHGGAVIRTLRELRRSRRLDTVVEGSGTCASMCVPVYLQGEERRATGRSRWMFHEVSLRDAISKEQQDISPADRKARTDKLFDDYFRPAGVPEAWIKDMRERMRGGDVWRSGDELLAERANIVLDRM